MKKTIKRLIDDFEYRSYIGTVLSFFVNIMFAVYNWVVGFVYNIIWHQTIGLYYFVLIFIKFWILNFEKRNADISIEEKVLKRRTLYIFTSTITFVLNIALIAPIILMIRHEKTVSFGLTWAIVFAAYTTYKITLSIISFRKSRKTKNIILQQLKNINVIDAVVSLLSLQYALIVINGDIDKSMELLMTASSTIMFLFIVIFSIIQFIRGLKINTDQIIELIKEEGY